MSSHTGGQDCAWSGDEIHVIAEDEPCYLAESGDVLCVACGSVLVANFPGEAQFKERLEDVHPDWRVPRKT